MTQIRDTQDVPVMQKLRKEIIALLHGKGLTNGADYMLSPVNQYAEDPTRLLLQIPRSHRRTSTKHVETAKTIESALEEVWPGKIQTTKNDEESITQKMCLRDLCDDRKKNPPPSSGRDDQIEEPQEKPKEPSAIQATDTLAEERAVPINSVTAWMKFSANNKSDNPAAKCTGQLLIVATSRILRISVSEILSEKRTVECVTARRAITIMLRWLYPKATLECSAKLLNRDHTSVLRMLHIHDEFAIPEYRDTKEPSIRQYHQLLESLEGLFVPQT